MTLSALMVPLAGTALANHECYLELEPETDTNPIGSQHTITATIPPTPVSSDCDDGQVIEFEIVGPGDANNDGDTTGSPDLTCTIQNGTCSITYSSNTPGTDTVRGWCDRNDCTTQNGAGTGAPDNGEVLGDTDQDETDVVQKRWLGQGADACALEVEPEQDTNNTGTQHRITATVVPRNQGDCPNEVQVDFEVTGPNDPDAGDTPQNPDFTCTVQAPATSCTVQYTGANIGTDEITGWIDNDQDNSTPDFDQAEARDEAATDGDKTEPDDTDVVEKTWTNNPGTRLDCTPNNPSNPATNPGADETFTCRVTDANGNAIPNVSVDAENLNGSNDPDNDATGGAASTADYSCTSNSNTNNGECTITVTSAGEPGPANICFWIDGDNDNIFDVAGAPDDGGNCDNEGVNENPENNDETDIETKTWVARQADSLDCTPDTDTNPTGSQHTITCQTIDQFDQNFQQAGTLVDVEFLQGSPNDPQNDGTAAPPDFNDISTNAQGQVTIQYSGANTGTDTICSWIDADSDTQVPDEGDCNEANQPDDNDDTDVVTKTWTSGQEQRLDCSPETDANHVTLTHQINCQMVNQQGNDVATAGIQVKAEASGANDPDGANPNATPDFTCTTDATGACSFTHDPANNQPGTTTYRIWVGTDPDLTEGQNDTNNPGSNFQEPDNTDVVTKTWHGEATTLTQTPESDSAALGTCNVFTVTMTDAQQRPVGNAILDVQQTHANFNNGNATDDADLRFCSRPEVQAADPNAPNPSNVTETGAGNTGRVHGHVDRGTNANGQVSYGVFVDNNVQGNVQVLAFCDNTQVECPNEDNDNQPDTNELQDVSTKTWGGGGADAVETVACTPETDTNPNGTRHDFLCTLTNANNSPVPGVTPVGDVTAGPNANETTAALTFTCGASNQQGVSACSYQDSGASPVGTDTIEIWVQQSATSGGGSAARDAGEPFDTISKTWATPPSGLGINLTCDDTNGPSRLARQDADTAVEDSIDCFNALANGTETFTARVTNPNGNTDASDDTPVSGVQVAFNIPQGNTCDLDGDNIAAEACETPEDIGFTPASGPDGDGPVFCTTGNDGTCSVTVTNPTPTDGDYVLVDASVFGQTSAGFGNNRDRAGKQWVSPDRTVSITLTPQGATNQTGSSHTVTATVRNVFGDPLVGRNVDFDITGRNDNAGAVEGRDRTTDANGQATFTYNDAGPPNQDGQDTITAWADDEPEDDAISGTEPNINAVKFWRTQLPTTTNVKLDMENANCPTGAGAFNQDDDPQTANDEGFTQHAQPNQVNNAHAICAVAFDENNNVIVDGDITLTITGGPGFFTNANGDNLGTTVTVPVQQNGAVFAAVNSTTTGVTQVTASKDGQSDVGNKPWVSFPARNIECTPETGVNEPGEDHEVECLVTDRQGNPVAGWQVYGTESGPGSMQQTGGLSCDPIVTGSPNTCIQTTNAQGIAPFTLQNNTNQLGTQTLDVELANMNSGARASQDPAVDECERPANNPNPSPAGNCTDQVTKTWQEEVAECADTQDNDNDGLIDEDDPGCLDANGDYDPDDDDETDEEQPPIVTDGPCQGFAQGSSNPHPTGAGRIVVGTDGPDLLLGTNADDIICGLGGNDVIDAADGDDLVVGNSGDDTVDAGNGEDVVKGGGGDDTLDGKGGKDNLEGKAGDDTLIGRRGHDAMKGQAGNDTLKGNRGLDTLRGGKGKDTLQGGKQDDILRGGKGNDTLKGFTGDDILNGGADRDTCKPGRGNDKVRNCEK